MCLEGGEDKQTLLTATSYGWKNKLSDITGIIAAPPINPTVRGSRDIAKDEGLMRFDQGAASKVFPQLPE